MVSAGLGHAGLGLAGIDTMLGLAGLGWAALDSAGLIRLESAWPS